MDNFRPGGEHGGSLPHKKGTAVSWLLDTVETLRRRREIVYCQYGVRELQPPGVLLRPGPTGRFDKEYKTRTSSAEKELKGESNETVADGDIGTKNSAGAGAENILHGDCDDLRRRRPHGRL